MRNYSNGIWWFRLKPDLESTRVMPSGCRITKCENGVLLSYPDKVIRWISDTYFDDVDTDRL